MATNPRIPLPGKMKPQPVPVDGVRRAGQAANLLPGSIIGFKLTLAVLGLAIVTATFYYISRVQARVEMQTPLDQVIPADGEGMHSEVELSALEMTQANAGGPLELHGRLLNAGNHSITGAIVQVTFRNSAGKVLSTVQEPILSTMVSDDPGVSNDFTDDSIQPDQRRPFRVIIKHPPAHWNNQLPDVKVITVSTDLD